MYTGCVRIGAKRDAPKMMVENDMIMELQVKVEQTWTEHNFGGLFMGEVIEAEYITYDDKPNPDPYGWPEPVSYWDLEDKDDSES